MITELIENYGLKVIGNDTIDLGYVNGWGQGMYEVHQLLKSKLVPNSQVSSTIANCVNEHRFIARDGNSFYKVVLKIDSGD